MITIDVETDPELGISDEAVNTVTYVDQHGDTVAVSKAVRFELSGGLAGTAYMLTVVVESSGGNTLVAEQQVYVLTAASLWTSRSELEQMFGLQNVEQWADLSNDQDADEISSRIDWAMIEATEDAKDRLRPSPVVLPLTIPAPRALRLAVTRIAGVLLYEARGVKDTSDEEGKHRLSTHRKQADRFFQHVLSGKIRISAVTWSSHPAIVTDDASYPG